MRRWLVPAVAAAWLAAAAVWLLTASPRGGEPSVQAQLWGGRSAQPRAMRPNVRGNVCELEQLDRTRTSARVCVSCHDGTIGPGVQFRMGPDDSGMSHPVDTDYASAHAKQPDKYVPPGALPVDVPLVEGRVACTSCHDPASTEPKHVARPGSLCSACHIM